MRLYILQSASTKSASSLIVDHLSHRLRSRHEAEASAAAAQARAAADARRGSRMDAARSRAVAPRARGPVHARLVDASLLRPLSRHLARLARHRAAAASA